MFKFYNLFYLNYFILELSTIPNVLVLLFFSLILIEGFGSFIHFSGGIKKVIKDLGSAALLGGAAKLGADGVDYLKDELSKKITGTNSGNDDTKGKVSSEGKSNTSNDSSDSSNTSHTSNNNK